MLLVDVGGTECKECGWEICRSELETKHVPLTMTNKYFETLFNYKEMSRNMKHVIHFDDTDRVGRSLNYVRDVVASRHSKDVMISYWAS